MATLQKIVFQKDVIVAAIKLKIRFYFLKIWTTTKVVFVITYLGTATLVAAESGREVVVFNSTTRVEPGQICSSMYIIHMYVLNKILFLI